MTQIGPFELLILLIVAMYGGAAMFLYTRRYWYLSVLGGVMFVLVLVRLFTAVIVIRGFR